MRISGVYLLVVRIPGEHRSDVLAVFSDCSEVERMAEHVRESHTFEGIELDFNNDSDVYVTSRSFYGHTR